MLRQVLRVTSGSLVSARTTSITSIRLMSDVATASEPSTISEIPTSQFQQESTSPNPQTQTQRPHIRIVKLQQPRKITSPEPTHKPSTSGSQPSQLEPYKVTRTRTGGLPVYKVTKGAGTLQLTRLRRVDGDLDALRNQLEQYLQPPPKKIEINRLNGHILVKGEYKDQVETFLAAKGF